MMFALSTYHLLRDYVPISIMCSPRCNHSFCQNCAVDFNWFIRFYHWVECQLCPLWFWAEWSSCWDHQKKKKKKKFWKIKKFKIYSYHCRSYQYEILVLVFLSIWRYATNSTDTKNGIQLKQKAGKIGTKPMDSNDFFVQLQYYYFQEQNSA